ncbi:MAG: methyltransferase domain-containing protein [Nitrospirae bacterium]|nr:methyltransferase domain-containing protein [Nitrospirota bacterium]
MAKSCCESRETRLEQYQIDKWKVKESEFKTFKPDDLLYSPQYIKKEKNGVFLLIDPQSPNWLSTNNIGAEIIALCDGKHKVSDIQEAMFAKYGASGAEHIKKETAEFINAAGTMEFISGSPFLIREYPGRGKVIAPHKMDELWIYNTMQCNLRCKHCLVSAGKELKDELTGKEIKKLVDEAIELGVKRFYITGGEPFMKDDIFEVIKYITKEKNKELIIQTNATLFDDKKISALKDFKSPLLTIQASLEGPDAKIHDSIRGKGSFNKAVEGVKKLIDIGITPVIATAISKYNEDSVTDTSKFLSTLGVKDHHILWMHTRGRGASNVDKLLVPSDRISNIMQDLRKIYKEGAIIVDNEESLKVRLKAKRGRKNDLCNNCYEKVCVNSDGHVYPCASFNGDKRFDAGSIREKSLKDIWLNSKVMAGFRNSSVKDKEECSACYLKYFCGGGCTAQSYYASEVETGKGSFMAQEPYCLTYKTLFEEILWDLAREGAPSDAKKKGYATPFVYNAMDGKLPPYLSHSFKTIDDNFEVGCYHCSCVLAVDVEDDEAVCKPDIKGQVTKTVKKKFSTAAHVAEANYYCPTGYNPKDLEHIPTEVLDVSYGCGNPAAIAELKEGDVVLDLGSGAGIDCFIAAKRLGKNGRVIGLDMTDEMVEKAAESAKKVAKSLGYDIVEFKKGELMNMPVEDNSIDLVISNCVVNLTEDKAKVMDEVFRVLKPGGRFVISDIVADKPIPGFMRRDKELWAACLSGALTEERFLEAAVEAGLTNVNLTKNYLYKKVEYINFYSVTMKGFKPQKITCGGCP